MFQESLSAKYEIISRDVESAPVWYVTNKSQGVQFEIGRADVQPLFERWPFIF